MRPSSAFEPHAPQRSLVARWLLRLGRPLLLLCALLLLTGCEQQQMVITSVDEREANEIIVFLASKGIAAKKVTASAAAVGGETNTILFNLFTEQKQTTEAMAYLNQAGFPRKKGVSLLELFAKQGMMQSEKDSQIRYQAGLAAQIASTIRKIDGVLECDVTVSFPPEETTMEVGAPKEKITASVYVKHQGIFDDPNSHLVSKIKRLVAGAVTGLDVNDVTVISDRSRLTEAQPELSDEMMPPREFVSIWSIVMSQASAMRFRLLFGMLLFSMLSLLVALGWLVWKCYPALRRAGWKEWFRPAPFSFESAPSTSLTPTEEERSTTL